jgi:hypothetical protein
MAGRLPSEMLSRAERPTVSEKSLVSSSADGVHWVVPTRGEGEDTSHIEAGKDGCIKGEQATDKRTRYKGQTKPKDPTELFDSYHYHSLSKACRCILLLYFALPIVSYYHDHAMLSVES